MGLRETVKAAQDVQSETAFIEAWNTDIEFRGMSYAALTTLQGTSIAEAAEGNLNSAIELLSAVICDPETHDLAFADEEGRAILRSKSPEVIQECMNVALRVLGIDEADTAGKDSSGTPSEASPTAAA